MGAARRAEAGLSGWPESEDGRRPANIMISGSSSATLCAPTGEVGPLSERRRVRGTQP